MLHDARSTHKGRLLLERLATSLPEYRFEALACPSADVPSRMRKAAAFVHLSRYEGNSIVCNEAMASLAARQQRLALAQQNSWDSRVSKLLALVDAALEA